MHSSKTGTKFTMEELATLAACPRRTVRYYVQSGLLEPPEGAGRAAHYTGVHLAALLQIKKLAAGGVSLERIREILRGGDVPVPPRNRRPGEVEVRSHIFIAPGIELQIASDDTRATPEQIRAFARAAADAAQRIFS
ncbi:MAG: helix-turn-helix domain-containing protein [Puniceicoccales bacterium]|jgi:DNA-binding transcriptional MerR regulator|nr:helix-turn-helix domain-containing protein [Puniceicoccales bacterium]